MPFMRHGAGSTTWPQAESPVLCQNFTSPELKTCLRIVCSNSFLRAQTTPRTTTGLKGKTHKTTDSIQHFAENLAEGGGQKCRGFHNGGNSKTRFGRLRLRRWILTLTSTCQVRIFWRLSLVTRNSMWHYNSSSQLSYSHFYFYSDSFHYGSSQTGIHLQFSNYDSLESSSRLIRYRVQKQRLVLAAAPTSDLTTS